MKIKRSTLVLWKKRLVFFLVTALVMGVFYVYFKTPVFTVTSYEFVGVQEMYKDRIDSNLRTLTSQTRYKVFPSNRIMMYPSKLMKLSISEVLPNSEKIDIVPIGLHTLRVRVTPYEPLFKIDEVHGITKDGVIYTEFKDMSKLSTISIASSTRKEIDRDGIHSTQIEELDTETLSNITKLINKIDTVIFIVRKIDIDASGDISFFDERGISKIIFSGKANTEKVWSNLVSAIDTDPLKSKLMNEKDSLEYLDARFGNKVFFKFTKGDKTAIIQSHATTTATTSISQ
ncbi:hypothetical protein K9M47_00595 [Candidatus Gracilibacteria bacterium]|nr:hypothetical protein [Candidatus Gracilibacteria bacterium]